MIICLLFKVPVWRGCLLRLFGFAANEVTHCIRYNLLLINIIILILGGILFIFLVYQKALILTLNILFYCKTAFCFTTHIHKLKRLYCCQETGF